MVSVADAIDYNELDQIDREIDAAMERGTWAKEHFDALWRRALIACGGRTELLGFMRDLAAPGWLTGRVEGRSMQRLSRPVREFVGWIRSGWSPFVAIPRGAGAFRWNDREILAEEVRVDLNGNVATFTVQVSPEAIDAEFLQEEPRSGLVRDRLEATLRHGWNVVSDRAVCEKKSIRTEPDGVSASLVFRASSAVFARSDESPELWVLALGSGPDLPSGQNLRHSTTLVLDGENYARDSGWCGFRLEGALCRVLVQRKTTAGGVEHFLLLESSGRELDPALLRDDLLALQFVLGRALLPDVAYGVRQGEVVALTLVGRWATRKRGNHQETIPEHLHLAAWHANMFNLLASSLRGGNAHLSAALHLYVRALDDLLETAVQLLLRSIAILTFDVRTTPLPSHGERVRAFLKARGVTLPSEVWARVNEAARHVEEGRLFDEVPSSVERLMETRAELRCVVVAMIAASVGYGGPIAPSRHTETTPVWWPSPREEEPRTDWAASTSPEVIAPNLRADQVVVLVGRPEQVGIVRWLVRAAGIPEALVVLTHARSEDDLRARSKVARALGDRLFVVVDHPRGHVPSAMEHIRDDLGLRDSSVLVLPAIPSVEAWLFADESLVPSQSLDPETRRDVVEPLPEELVSVRALAHEVYGPPSRWAALPPPDVYRAADRSPSLRRFLSVLGGRLGMQMDLPARSVARGISRDAIAGLMRDLLHDDAVAWRTLDGSTYTAAELAREIEQGTETGRQYTVDLVSMMINALARSARRAKTA